MHIEQLPSGSWRAIVQINGRRRRATAKTRALAERAGAQMILDEGGTPTATSTTVAELIAMHLEQHDYRATTLADMTRVAAKLPAKFTARAVDSVTPVVIDGLYRQLARDGWSSHRIRRVHGLLTAVFKRAKRWGWVAVIPTRDADLPSIEEREETTPAIDQVRALLIACDAAELATDEAEYFPGFGLFVRLAATTGARRGELCGLQWADFDAAKSTLKIRRAVAYTPATGVVAGDVKTGAKGRHGVHIGAATVDRIKAHRAEQNRQVLALDGGERCAWVFSSDFVHPWRPDSVSRKFRELADSLGMNDVRLHDLRHFVATDMIHAGEDPRTVADHVGHARPSMTLDKYTSGVAAKRRQAADDLEHRLSS